MLTHDVCCHVSTAAGGVRAMPDVESWHMRCVDRLWVQIMQRSGGTVKERVTEAMWSCPCTGAQQEAVHLSWCVQQHSTLGRAQSLCDPRSRETVGLASVCTSVFIFAGFRVFELFSMFSARCRGVFRPFRKQKNAFVRHCGGDPSNFRPFSLMFFPADIENQTHRCAHMYVE